MLIAMVPYFTMAQKRSKRGSKTDKVTASVKSSYEFLVIKGAEIDMSEQEGVDETEKEADDISLERRMKRLIKPPVHLVVSFESADMRGAEIGELMRKSNEFRTMSAAVMEASSYGWEFINANSISTKDGIIHYYYMKRNK